MLCVQEPLKHKPKCRVELHIHLDGSIRHETIWEAMRLKGMKLPGSGSLADLINELKVDEPKDLCHFLKGFGIFLPAFLGDLTLIERIGYEFVEDQANESIAYCEARFCPHLLLPNQHNENSSVQDEGQEANGINGTADDDKEGSTGESVTADAILEAALRGLRRGEEEFGTKVRLVLCCIRGMSDNSKEILRLCEEYRDKGVVGIDIAGSEDSGAEESNKIEEAIFHAAKERGIHRTIHAGEAGPAESVKEAIEVLGAERIGHGYRVLEDESIYQMCIKENIHFEVCPHSSYYTGTIKSMTTASKRHPVLRFAEDEVSFSINSDDPTITQTRLTQEYKLLAEWGFTEAHFTRANLQAAIHSFLPPEEKKLLVDELRKAYGIVDYILPSPPSQSPVTTRTPTPTQTPKPSITFGTWAERA